MRFEPVRTDRAIGGKLSLRGLCLFEGFCGDFLEEVVSKETNFPVGRFLGSLDGLYN